MFYSTRSAALKLTLIYQCLQDNENNGVCKTSIVSVYVGKTTRPIVGNKTLTQWPRPLSRRNFITGDTIPASFADTSLLMVGLIKRRRRRCRRCRLHRWYRRRRRQPVLGTISGPFRKNTCSARFRCKCDGGVYQVSAVLSRPALFCSDSFTALLRLPLHLFAAVPSFVCHSRYIYTPITRENVRRLYCVVKVVWKFIVSKI